MGVIGTTIPGISVQVSAGVRASHTTPGIIMYRARPSHLPQRTTSRMTSRTRNRRPTRRKAGSRYWRLPPPIPSS